MRRIFLSLSLIVLASAFSTHAGDLWQTNFEAAQAQAAKEKKHVLIDFTGSDWCGWCIKLDEEVFQKPAFKAFAKENLVLVTADFPESKQLPKKLVKQNDALAAKYKIEGYPTLVILDSDGKKVGEMGYVEGGPKPFLAQLKDILDK